MKKILNEEAKNYYYVAIQYTPHIHVYTRTHNIRITKSVL